MFITWPGLYNYYGMKPGFKNFNIRLMASFLFIVSSLFLNSKVSFWKKNDPLRLHIFLNDLIYTEIKDDSQDHHFPN